jgi:hypothetical protein
MTDFTSRPRGKVMTPSELKASNDQLRNWNADYRRQIAGLESRNASGIEHVAELETIIVIKRGRIKELESAMRKVYFDLRKCCAYECRPGYVCANCDMAEILLKALEKIE